LDRVVVYYWLWIAGGFYIGCCGWVEEFLAFRGARLDKRFEI
jgi:hypothetical protein